MQRAFSLIELLVVTTIVVVLLSLLTPALDRVVYQAELTACAGNQKGVAVGTDAYALSFNRSYPSRPTASMGREPYLLAQSNFDDRPVIRNFIPINKCLRDPLTQSVNLEQTRSDSYVFLSYSLWFGFGYDGHRGLSKIGDLLEWTDSDQGTPFDRRYNVLISDHDVNTIDQGLSQLAHPDTNGVLSTYVRQDEHPDPSGNDSSYWVFSIWRGPARSPGDVNIAFTDQSVRRYGHVRWNEWQQDNTQMARVPVARDVGAVPFPFYYHQLPIRSCSSATCFGRVRLYLPGMSRAVPLNLFAGHEPCSV